VDFALEEIYGNAEGVEETEPVLERFGLARGGFGQNYFAGDGIAADDDLLALKAEFPGQAHGLAAAVHEELGGLSHGFRLLLRVSTVIYTKTTAQAFVLATLLPKGAKFGEGGGGLTGVDGFSPSATLSLRSLARRRR